MLFPSEITPQCLSTMSERYGLSNAELEVVSLVLKVESPTAIANRLSISSIAARKRLSEVYHKMAIEGRGPVKFAQLQKRVLSHCDRPPTPSAPPRKRKIPVTTLSPIDWDCAPEVSLFAGRETELALLNDWIIQQNCRLVGLFGMRGMGKTTLAVKIAQQIQEQFDFVVWRSLSVAPSVTSFVEELIQFFGRQQNCTYPNGKASLETKIAWLVNFFRSHRCLIILDDYESLFKPRELSGIYRENYQGYGQFLLRMGKEASKSCILVAGAEKIPEIALLEGIQGAIHSIMLEGLGKAGYGLLENKSLSLSTEWEQLIEIYQGNPLMLKLAAMTIQEVFDGNVSDFLKTTVLTQEITDLVENCLQNLSKLEKKILILLAKEKVALNLHQLQEKLAEVSQKNLLRAVQSLRMRALVKKVEAGFILIPVVQETLFQLIETVESSPLSEPSTSTPQWLMGSLSDVTEIEYPSY